MAEGIDRLFSALEELDESSGSRATSVRLPEALHRAVLLAADMGMDESFTAATTNALTDRLLAFARRTALAEHFARFPDDRPSLAAVANRRVSGSDHPAASHPGLVADAAAWVESRTPDWATSGAVDEAVDEVIGYVEMLAAGVGASSKRPA